MNEWRDLLHFLYKKKKREKVKREMEVRQNNNLTFWSNVYGDFIPNNCWKEKKKKKKKKKQKKKKKKRKEKVRK